MNNWTKLNPRQLGKYGEYLSKMEFTKSGFDVYTPDIDDKSIDFIIRKNENEYFDIQVKSVRNHNYVFMKKNLFIPRKNLYLSLVLFEENQEPLLFLIPSLAWFEKSHKFLVSRNYENKKSNPEWGISITKSNFEEIKKSYSFERQINYF